MHSRCSRSMRTGWALHRERRSSICGGSGRLYIRLLSHIHVSDCTTARLRTTRARLLVSRNDSRSCVSRSHWTYHILAHSFRLACLFSRIFSVEFLEVAQESLIEVLQKAGGGLNSLLTICLSQGSCLWKIELSNYAPPKIATGKLYS